MVALIWSISVVSCLASIIHFNLLTTLAIMPLLCCQATQCVHLGPRWPEIAASVTVQTHKPHYVQWWVLCPLCICIYVCVCVCMYVCIWHTNQQKNHLAIPPKQNKVIHESPQSTTVPRANSTFLFLGIYIIHIYIYMYITHIYIIHIYMNMIYGYIVISHRIHVCYIW